jgi:hypothetical protein
VAGPPSEGSVLLKVRPLRIALTGHSCCAGPPPFSLSPSTEKLRRLVGRSVGQSVGQSVSQLALAPWGVACRRVRLVGTRAESDLSGWEGSMTMVDTGAHSPGVQRASSATSTSKFDNIGGWVGLEGVTSLPVRCDMHVGRASEGISHQPGWNSSRPTTSPSPFPRPAGR